MQYITGNTTILEMIHNHNFDTQLADVLLVDVDFNEPILDLYGFSTTYLAEAVDYDNVAAVEYFLVNGADPNYCNLNLEGYCALFQLQYPPDEDVDYESRIKIQKLFFKFGANPNLEVEGETIYEYVLFKVYNDPPGNEKDMEILMHFYKLLVLYGGGGNGSYKPELQDIDLNQIDDYDIELFLCDDNYHIGGQLVDKDGNIHGKL